MGARSGAGLTAVLAAGLVLVSVVAWSAAQGGSITPTTPKRGGNPAAATIANPVPATPASVAAGRQTYLLQCLRCHGPSGKGDGGGAGAGGQPADFTDDRWDFGSSDGEIFAAIQAGDLPGHGRVRRADQRAGDLEPRELPEELAALRKETTKTRRHHEDHEENSIQKYFVALVVLFVNFVV